MNKQFQSKVEFCPLWRGVQSEEIGQIGLKPALPSPMPKAVFMVVGKIFT